MMSLPDWHWNCYPEERHWPHGVSLQWCEAYQWYEQFGCPSPQCQWSRLGVPPHIWETWSQHRSGQPAPGVGRSAVPLSHEQSKLRLLAYLCITQLKLKLSILPDVSGDVPCRSLDRLPHALLMAAILAMMGRLWMTKDTSLRCCLAKFCAWPRIPKPVMSVAACALKVCIKLAAAGEKWNLQTNIPTAAAAAKPQCLPTAVAWKKLVLQCPLPQTKCCSSRRWLLEVDTLALLKGWGVNLHSACFSQMVWDKGVHLDHWIPGLHMQHCLTMIQCAC